MSTLNALFERSVRRQGDALAVRDAHGSCSYREMQARATALACELHRQGVRAGDAVIVHAERSVETVIAVVAVLQAGGVFVPVSLDTPPARVESIVADAGAALLLVDRAAHARLARRGLRTLLIDVAFPESDAPVVQVRPDDPAYIIYTSGTSGQPKGIMIEHGSIARRFEDWDLLYGMTSGPFRCLQVAKLGFDVFIADVVKALGSGGVLVICPPEAVLDPAKLHALLVEESIDYVDIVPAVLRNLLEHLEATGCDLASLRMLNVGADLWTRDEYERARRITRVPRLFNSYGVTECTVENTLFEDDGTLLANRSALPIGRALPSDTILILDEELNVVEPGATGQICIGGPCVARGYVNRSELNERAFFVRADGMRFYKTGDLGRADRNGIIEFLGRIDFQVKVNGNRIELEEIERVLERFDSVRQAVVCYDSKQRVLVAFVRTTAGASWNAAECAAYLARHLPAYMLPARTLVVDTFPLNQNGKVDRVRLVADLAASAGEPRRHDLHESRSAGELRERLARRGVDLLSLVNEFVKPSARFGLLVTGALANGTADGASPVELLVLLDDERALKRRKPDVAGCPVDYDGTRASLSVDGVRIALDFVTGATGAMMAPAWTIDGHEIVERMAREATG